MKAIPREVIERQVRRLYGVAPDAALDALPDPLKSYVAYSLTTVERGRWALEELRPYGLRQGFRFLDAGCAYGGYLAAAVELGAREVVGVELNEKYLDIARELLAAGEVPAALHRGSLSDPALLPTLGSFDVVTCADVIEHVDDPTTSLRHLTGAIAPGGMLYLAVPNFRCPANVRSDPHFQRFGISLLPPAPAREYSRLVSGTDYYDVGEFHPLGFYVEAMRQGGLEVELINRPASARSAASQLRAEARELFGAADAFREPKLTPALVAEVRTAVKAVAREILASLDRTRFDSWFRRDRGEPLQPVVDEYAVQTWHLLGRRPGVQGEVR